MRHVEASVPTYRLSFKPYGSSLKGASVSRYALAASLGRVFVPPSAVSISGSLNVRMWLTPDSDLIVSTSSSAFDAPWTMGTNSMALKSESVGHGE